jgi:hypothetical protein
MASVSRERFVAWFGPRRHPSSYFVQLAAPAISALLEMARATSPIHRAVLLGLPASDIVNVLGTSAFVRAPLHVWILRDADEVRLFLRQTHNIASAFVRYDESPPNDVIASSGPRAPAFVDVELTCPHCHTKSSRFRDIIDAWVCPACSRSFRVG